MEKWDLLTVILRDNELVELLDAMYELTNKTNNMTDTIKQAAIQWKWKNPFANNEIVEKIINEYLNTNIAEK